MMHDSVSSDPMACTMASGFEHENNITAKKAVMLRMTPIFRIRFNYFLALIVVASPIHPPTWYAWPSLKSLKKMVSIDGKAAV